MNQYDVRVVMTVYANSREEANESAERFIKTHLLPKTNDTGKGVYNAQLNFWETTQSGSE